jgi:murein L,D-transpeptidase YcbB/YkuD
METIGSSLGTALTAEVRSDPELAVFYRARSNKTLWVQDGRLRPEAEQVLRLIEGAAADGLNPASYAPDELRLCS